MKIKFLFFLIFIILFTSCSLNRDFTNNDKNDSTVFIAPNTTNTTETTISDESNKFQLNNLKNLYNYFYNENFGKSNFLGRISFTDLNADGSTAVIFHIVEKAGMMGTDYMYALDGTDDLIATWHTRSGENKLYIDDDSNLHIISLYKFFASANNQFTAYQDILFNNNIIKYEIPFIININAWFEDDGEHRFAWNIYGDYNNIKGIDLGDVENIAIPDEYFIMFIENYDDFDIHSESISGDVLKLIDEYVYRDLKYIKDIEFINVYDEISFKMKPWSDVSSQIKEMFDRI